MQIREIDLASRGKRLAAFTIDNLPITFFIALIYFNFFGFEEVYMTYVEDPSDADARAEFLRLRNQVRDISFFLYLAYSILMEGSELQATFGKRLMKIKVVHESGEPLSLIKALNRNISKIISSVVFSMGFIWILFDKNHQGWHDKIAKTFVVNEDFELSAAPISNVVTPKPSGQDMGSPKEFYSINNGNQLNLLYEPVVDKQWIEKVKNQHSWDDFDEYDNRMWEYISRLFDDVIKGLNINDYSLLWNNLSRGQKTLWTFSVFNADTNNGGVYQFLLNWPEFIFSVQELWKEIGMETLAKDYDHVIAELTENIGDIQEFKEKFDNKDSDWKTRWTAFTAGYDQIKSAKVIESYYYDKDFKKKLYQAVSEYVENNVDQFV